MTTETIAASDRRIVTLDVIRGVAVMGILSVSSALALKWYLHRSNKKLYRQAIENGTAYQPYVT